MKKKVFIHCMIKCLLTECGQAGHENIWLSVRMHRWLCSVCTSCPQANKYIISSVTFFWQVLQKLSLNLLRLNTLIDTKTMFLTPERYDNLPQSFLCGSPPPSHLPRLHPPNCRVLIEPLFIKTRYLQTCLHDVLRLSI